VTDTYPDQLHRVITAFLTGGRIAGAQALAPIAYPPRRIAPRPVMTRTQAAFIFARDNFVCRYCGGKTVLTAVMELIAHIYPDEFPYHPNWKGGLTHPVVIARSAAVDHVIPVSQGGPALHNDNLVTACWPCNAAKADLSLDQLGWTLKPIENTRWRGLTEHYEELWHAAGQPNPVHHQAWIAALGLNRP
jgi:5-methylcytosine-specific restriction endonuclease McrA